MKTMTVTELHSNIYNLLQEVLDTGVPREINTGGQKLRITPVAAIDKFANLIYRPHVINGNPEELVHLEWEYTVD